jgi:hypothetical protein
MVLRLQVENGKIKNYSTSYKSYYSKGECVFFDIKSKCDASEHTDCIHLDCAIYAAEYTAKDNKSGFKILLAAAIFWFLVLRDLGLCGLIVLFGVYFILQAIRSAKKARELIEFRDRGTINGVKAHML